MHDELRKILDGYLPTKTLNSDYIFPELKDANNNPKDILRVTKIKNKGLYRFLGQIADRIELE